MPYGPKSDKLQKAETTASKIRSKPKPKSSRGTDLQILPDPVPEETPSPKTRPLHERDEEHRLRGSVATTIGKDDQDEAPQSQGIPSLSSVVKQIISGATGQFVGSESNEPSYHTVPSSKQYTTAADSRPEVTGQSGYEEAVIPSRHEIHAARLLVREMRNLQQPLVELEQSRTRAQNNRTDFQERLGLLQTELREFVENGSRTTSQRLRQTCSAIGQMIDSVYQSEDAVTQQEAQVISLEYGVAQSFADDSEARKSLVRLFGQHFAASEEHELVDYGSGPEVTDEPSAAHNAFMSKADKVDYIREQISALNNERAELYAIPADKRTAEDAHNLQTYEDEDRKLRLQLVEAETELEQLKDSYQPPDDGSPTANPVIDDSMLEINIPRR